MLRRVKNIAMKLKRNISIVTVLLALTILSVLPIQNITAGEFGGQTAAKFLTIDLGAPAAAMGGAYTAQAQGALASFWNPAQMARAYRSDLVLGHISWLQDISLEYGAFARPVSDNWVMSGAIVYLGYGDIPGYDQTGAATGSLSAYDMMISASAAYKVTDRFSAGLTTKFVNQKLDRVSASTVAFDIGFQYIASRWNFALVVANIGSPMKFESVSEKLPSEVRLGLSTRPFDSDIMWSGEIRKQLNGGIATHNGFQYGYDNSYYVRSGWQYQQSGVGAHWLSSFSSGVGSRFGDYSIDYAFTLKNSLTDESLHRFSVSFSFD